MSLHSGPSKLPLFEIGFGEFRVLQKGKQLSLLAWAGVFIGNLVFAVWILKLGGADFLEDIWSGAWEADQWKLYTLLELIGITVWFFIGVFVPEARFEW